MWQMLARWMYRHQLGFLGTFHSSMAWRGTSTHDVGHSRASTSQQATANNDPDCFVEAPCLFGIVGRFARSSDPVQTECLGVLPQKVFDK